jgi:hypothetical protein
VDRLDDGNIMAIQSSYGPLAFCSTSEALVLPIQAQNEYSRGRKTKGSALNLPAAFADINIHKSRSVYDGH